ncbi:TIGR04024 family LLM class F420-dependent oxidoreductase [Halococcus hamelinensis]|uniref:Alkanesulfonate monooxygenase n=1 Tax=Halococcus hamelinensis 100A6 TaxID=1132509 RepID=M0M5G6_9EURY|nr:TIGR04024 family LLM class F420-dependent oxidoreductase [Halococcus hamelinensis]EMA39610.1 alkanesulfonate monooxygenase [Halococcus hamelinensis 100A6]
MAREVFLPVAAQPGVDALCEQAERAEELGYDRAWLPETWGRDAVTVLTSIAHRTDEIGIGTSIVPVYSRSPALIGQTAATLQEVSDGRFRLGLGPSGPIVVENWHGVDYGNPLRRTRETVEVVKRVLSGEEVTYDGEYFDLAGFRLRCEPPEPRPPIDAAGMGPKSVELAGRFADGWHALLLTRDGLRDRLDDLRRGADLAGRDPENVRVTLSLTCAALDDPDRARESVRQHLAFYVGGMGTFYRDSLARSGHEATANEVYDRWQSRDRAAATAAIDDDLLDSLAVAGTPGTARDRLESFAAIEGVDRVAVSFPRDASLAEIEATIAALAP